MISGSIAREVLDSHEGRAVRTIHSGSSGATVRIVECPNGSHVAVKQAKATHVSAARQAEARDEISPWFAERLPKVLFAGPFQGHDVLVTECPSVLTFADAVAEQGSTPTLVTSWQGVISSLTEMWQESARPGYSPESSTRNHLLRLKRGIDGLGFTLASLGNSLSDLRSFVVNDTDHVGWHTAWQRLAALGSPAERVVCHGDPQPTNVLLDPELRRHLIDWEWSGLHHDWRMMVSHLIGWWFVDAILSHAWGCFTARRYTLSLAYQDLDLRSVVPWTDLAADAFQVMTDVTRRDQDLAAVSLHTALLLLREVPRASESRSRHHLLAPLLGEAVRLINSADNGPPHPLIQTLVQPSYRKTAIT